jgi:DNA-binding beta-propeller fold protein YncE
MTDMQAPVADVTAEQPQARSRRGRRILSLILIVLVLLLITASFFLIRLIMPQGTVAASVKDAGGLEWIKSIYGWGRAKDQQMVAPTSVAVAPDGTIWVVNPGNRRVIGFDPSGAYKITLAGTTKTPFLSPTDVGVDPAGNVYVAENTANRVLVLTPQGQQLREIRVQTPTAVTASADRIVVGSLGGFAILDKEGNLIKVIGQKGAGDGQFDGVNGIAIAKDGRIFVTDTYNNRVSAYGPRGNLIWAVRTGNPANKTSVKSSSKAPKASGTPANMQLPLQATLDGNGRLVVIDGFDMSMVVFDTKNGQAIKKYGAFGSVDGKLLYPSGIAYDPSRDYFAVADSGNDRVQIVRIPDSAPFNALTTASRMLTGPIRALLFPLILLILALAYALWQWMRRRRRRRQELLDQQQLAQAPVVA